MQSVGDLVLPCNTFRMLVYIDVPVFPLRAPATRGLRNWWLPSPLWHMGGKSPQKQRRPIKIEQNQLKKIQKSIRLNFFQ